MRSEHTIQQAGQVQDGPLRLGVFRTLENDRGPYAVLRLAVGAAEVRELTMRPGDASRIDGAGTPTLLAAVPSTLERRGSVRVALERMVPEADVRSGARA